MVNGFGVAASATSQVVGANLVNLGLGVLLVAVATIGATLLAQAMVDRAHRRNYARSMAYLRQAAE